MDMFAAIAVERRAVADLLGTLSDEQWDTQSGCGDWTVGEVSAHLTVVWNFSSADYAKRAFVNRSTWFKPQQALDAVNAETVAERLARGRHELASDIRAHAEDRTTPIGFDARAPLCDVVVHRRDIEQPLGIAPTGPPEHAIAALDAATARRFALFSSRKTLAGLSFRATDIDWQSGSGPEVTGPARMLAHAMWGRPTALDELSGSGLDTLSTRLSAR